MPYESASFDLVFCFSVFEHLREYERGLAEVARVLKPGGRLVILEITNPRRPPLSTFFGLWFDRIVPLLGTLADLDVLRRGADGGDGVIHTAFGLDFSDYERLSREDRAAIEAHLARWDAAVAKC